MEISNVKIRLNNVEPHDWIICSRCRAKFPVVVYIQHRNDPQSKCYRGKPRKKEPPPPPPVKKPDPIVTVIDLTLDEDDDDGNDGNENKGEEGGGSINNVIINLDEDEHDIASNSTATCSTPITNFTKFCSETKDELYSTTTTTNNNNNINKNTSNNNPNPTTITTTTTTTVPSFDSSSVFTASTTNLIHHRLEENNTSLDSDNIYEATTTTNHSIDVPSHNNQVLNENSVEQVEDIDINDADDDDDGNDEDEQGDACDSINNNDSSISEPDLLQCPYCEDYFLVEEHLENHKKNVHPNQLLSTSTPKTSSMNSDEEEKWTIDTSCVVDTVNQISIPSSSSSSSRRSSTCSENESPQYEKLDIDDEFTSHSSATTTTHTSKTVTSKSFQSSPRTLENEGFNPNTGISKNIASPKVPVNVVQPNSHKVMGVNKDNNRNSPQEVEDWLSSPGKSMDNDDDDDDDDDQFYAGQVNQKMNTQEYLPSTVITEKIFSSGFNDLTVYNNENIKISSTNDSKETDSNSTSDDDDDNNYKSRSNNNKTPRRNYQRKKKIKSTVQNNINDGYIRRNAALNPNQSYRENVCPYCGVDLSSSSRLEYHITTQHEWDVMEGQKKQDKFKRIYKEAPNSTSNSTSITNSKSKVTKSSPINDFEEEVVSISVKNGRKYKRVKCQYCSKILTAGYGYKYHIKAHQKSLEIESKGLVPKNGCKAFSSPKKNTKNKEYRRSSTKVSQSNLRNVKSSDDEDEEENEGHDEDYDGDYNIDQPEDLQQHQEDEKTQEEDEQNYYNGNGKTVEQDDRITSSQTKQQIKRSIYMCPHCNFTARKFPEYYFHKGTHQSKLRVKVKAVNPRKSVKRLEKKKKKAKQLEAKEEDKDEYHQDIKHSCSKTDPQLDLKKLNNDINDKNNNIQNPYKVTSQTTEIFKEPQTNETLKRKVEPSELETNKRRNLSKQLLSDQKSTSRFYCVMCSSDKFETSEELKTHLKANHGSAVVTAVNPRKNKMVEVKTLQLCRELTKITQRNDDLTGKNSQPSPEVLNRCPRMVVRVQANKAISSSFILTPKISSDISELKNGEETGKELFQCEFCPKKFYSNGVFLLHVLHHHSKVSTQKCPDCGKVFISNYHYEAHRISVHNNTSDNKSNNGIKTTNSLNYVSDAPFEQLSPTLKEEQASKYNRKPVLPPPDSKVSPLNKVKADIVITKHGRPSSLNIPTERDKNSVVKRHQCTFCRFNYPTSDALSEHIITAHKRISVTKPKRLLHPVFSS